MGASSDLEKVVMSASQVAEGDFLTAVTHTSGLTDSMTLYRHTKWIIIVILLAICSQSLAVTSSPMHGESTLESAPDMVHAAHAMDGHQEVEPSGHPSSGAPNHEEHCKFKCECTLGGCSNGAQIVSLSGFNQYLRVESKFGQLGQIAESLTSSPLYRPPIVR